MNLLNDKIFLIHLLYWIHTILLVWDTGCVVMNCLDHTQKLLHMLDSTWHALLQNLFGQMRVLSIPVLFLVSQSKYLYGYESEGQNFQNLIFILVIFKQNNGYTNQTVDRGQELIKKNSSKIWRKNKLTISFFIFTFFIFISGCHLWNKVNIFNNSK